MEDADDFLSRFKKAHKRLKVIPAEQGPALFQLLGTLYVYLVCHFGAKYSAYWWARMAAFLHRMMHNLLWVNHSGWRYVDDWLWRSRSSVAPLLSTLLAVFMVVCRIPMSWHKCRLNKQVQWIGLLANFNTRSWRLPHDELLKVLKFFALRCNHST